MLFFTLFGIVLANSISIGYSSQCPEGWEYFADDKTCIKAFDDRLVFKEAREKCQSFGGDLVQIDSKAKQNFVAPMMDTAISWIGLEDTKNDNHFTYVDGSELGDFTSWASGEPNNMNGNQDCVALEYYDYVFWYDTRCDKTLAFVCSMKKISCAEGWVYYPDNNLCIKSFDTPLSYNDARKKCQDEVDDGDLVEIKNEALTNFLLGLNLPEINWIGVRDSNDDQVFEYLDGSGLEEYQPWDDGEPNNWRGTEQCGMVYGQGGWAGKWNDAHCPDAHPFICSTRKTAN